MPGGGRRESGGVPGCVGPGRGAPRTGAAMLMSGALGSAQMVGSRPRPHGHPRRSSSASPIRLATARTRCPSIGRTRRTAPPSRWPSRHQGVGEAVTRSPRGVGSAKLERSVRHVNECRALRSAGRRLRGARHLTTESSGGGAPTWNVKDLFGWTGFGARGHAYGAGSDIPLHLGTASGRRHEGSCSPRCLAP